MHTVYDPEADTPIFFELTTAKVNDCKAAQNLPIMPGVTYVFDRAYDDYSWYYEMTNQGTWFVGRMKSSAVYEARETRENWVRSFIVHQTKHEIQCCHFYQMHDERPDPYFLFTSM